MTDTTHVYSGRDYADETDDEAIRRSFANAKPVATWPEPDLSILNANRRPAVPMPTALFGPALDILETIASGTSAPLDYPATAYLACCASLIGGKRRARPYATSAWAEPPILWIGIVGDPSSRKSPPLEAVVDPLRALERDGADLHKAALRGWREADTKAKAIKTDWERSLAKAIKDGLADLPTMPKGANEPDEPHRRRTLVMDSTPEAMAAILSGNPQGTLHYRDELAGWLQGFERYAPGGREFWLEAYGGRSFTVDRKGAKGPLTVPFNGVSVAGGIQPAKLADCLLNGADDGLVARFLWTWPDKLPFNRPTRIANMATLEAAYRRLEGLAWGIDGDGHPTSITLPLSHAAADLFEAWQKDNGEVDADASGLLKSFYGKMDGALLRIALTAELSAWAWRGGDEPREISAATTEAAAEWIDDYAKPMAERVYGDAAFPTSDRIAAMLARYIVKNRLQTFNKRDLKRSPHKSHLPMLRDAKAMDAALEVLIDGGIIAHVGKRDSGGPGRASGDYAVNPAAFGGAP
jgi:putative DNA primase/helicase